MLCFAIDNFSGLIEFWPFCFLLKFGWTNDFLWQFFAGIAMIWSGKGYQGHAWTFQELKFLKLYYKNEMSTYLQNRVLKRSPYSAIQWRKLLKWWSIKDIPLACWSSKTFQEKPDSTLDLRPQNLKHDCKWPLKTYFNKHAWTSSAKHEGNKWHNPLHQSSGIPNEMQLIKTGGTPNHEMQKELWSLMEG